MEAFVILVAPWSRCLFCGLITLSLPYLWKRRQRGPSYGSLSSIGKVAWFVRAIGIVFFTSGIIEAVRAGVAQHELLDAAADIATSIPGLALSGVLARLIIGPIAMNVEPKIRRLYWQGSTSLGVGLLAGSALLYLGGQV